MSLSEYIQEGILKGLQVVVKDLAFTGKITRRELSEFVAERSSFTSLTEAKYSLGEILTEVNDYLKQFPSDSIVQSLQRRVESWLLALESALSREGERVEDNVDRLLLANMTLDEVVSRDDGLSFHRKLQKILLREHQ